MAKRGNSWKGMLAICPEYDLGKLAEVPHDERPTEGRTEPASAAKQDAGETRGQANGAARGAKRLFTPEEVCMKMVEHGQGNYKRFNLGDTIQYSPTEVMKILKDELPKAL